MKHYDIAILTESRYDQPAEIDWYTRNILTEDQLLLSALEARGLKVIRVDWRNPDFDWSSTDFAILRSCWDYFHYFEAFSAWLERAARQTRFINPIEQLLWNLDKHYLEDLRSQGINTTETTFIEAGAMVSLREIHERFGWHETVLKPTVSGAGRHTYRIDQSNLEEHEQLFRELLGNEGMMVQPFQYNVPSRGEIAMMVFGGQYSHAVLKTAKAGDFRVQDDFGGSVAPYSPAPEEIRFAERAAAACQPLPVYARVDMIWDNNDELAVSELELLEPELWFRFKDGAAEKLAAEIERYMKEQPFLS